VKGAPQPIERRTSRRFSLVLPVLFRWTDSTEHYDVGHCANAGLGGMFVLSANCPPVGMQVEIEMNIPAFALVPRKCQLRCTGEVMRVEGCYQLHGFAVVGRIENGGDRDNAIEEVAVALRTKQQ
jgi:PilZ domain